MGRVYLSDNVGKVLEQFVNITNEVFGSKVTGIYLHGSLAMGCFRSDKSDIDFIVVVEEDIEDEQKMCFMEKLVDLNREAPKKGIEMSVVKKTYCSNFVYPTPFELHCSAAHLEWFHRAPDEYVRKMKGTDPDLAAHFMILCHYGITLWGKPVKEVFSSVPKENYIDSIMADVENAREAVLEEPIYIVLNLCRVLAYLKEGAVLSKKQGGEWGLQNLEPEYYGIVRTALQAYTSDEKMVVDKKQALAFCDWMRDNIVYFRQY
ncbi:MAG: DUF4111 domain-containing protein [Lachnospiraceae bacterium]|nr:DUF4111 domain-containing protein [Lachnospiraceae bacterium]